MGNYKRFLQERISTNDNIDYLNLIKLGIVDYDIDFFDEGHLNVSGADKVTQFWGEYISGNFDLPDHRLGYESEAWNEKDIESGKYKNTLLNNQTSVNEYLMMLRDNTYECQILLSNNITEESNPIIYKLIYNIIGV